MSPYRKTRKTPVAARELKVSYNTLINLIRFDKITPPDRDSSGDYAWSDEDLQRAREALASRTWRKGVPA
jgi:hypothetical protein